MKTFSSVLTFTKVILVHSKVAALLVVLAFFANGAMAQSIQCGVLSKPAPVGKAPFFTDRFGNTYSEAELLAESSGAKSMQCAGTGEFNLLIPQGATPAQEAVFCAVFSYLGGLIQSPATGGTVNIRISFDPGLPTGVGGTGTPFFSHQCGVGYSVVQEQINSANPSVPLHGMIALNPQYNWYTELDGDPPIGNDQLDLYTVVLHEALHVLGFASQVGASGNSLQGFYTIYDLHLTNPAGQPMILAKPGSGDCCMDYSFDFSAFPNMPDAILQGCGDVLYDVAQMPPVNAEYAFTPPLDDNTAANMLSHLDMACGNGEEYVMHWEISPGVVRRVVTATELEILCTLGYDVSSQCEPSCMLVVNDDGPFVLISNDDEESIHFVTLTDNDFIAGDYQIDFDFTCGNVGNLTFDVFSFYLTIKLNGTPTGAYEFCYTITSCDGKLCKSGTVKLLVIDPIDPTVCECEEGENLVNYGDFEDFPVGEDAYYPSFIAPFNQQVIRIPRVSGIPPFIEDNSVDIYANGANQYARFIRCDQCSQENLLMPLCDTVPEECSLSVTFDACADNHLNGNQPVTLGVWALSSLPAGLTLANTTVCNGQLFDNAGLLIGTCMGEVELTNCVGGVSFNTYTVELPAGSFSAPITHLWFFDYPSYQNLSEIFMDNVVVTSDCPHCEPPCDIELVQECLQTEEGCSYAQITIYYNGQPIPNNDPDCTIVWEFFPKPVIPQPVCPGLPPQPPYWDNPKFLPNCQNYRVSIFCGSECYHVEEGIVDCGEVGCGEKNENGNDFSPEGWALPSTGEAPATIFPNPARKEIAIRLNAPLNCDGNCSLQMFDSYGRPVLAYSPMDDDQWQVVDISSLPPGVYYWRLTQNGSEIVGKGKIVVIH